MAIIRQKRKERFSIVDNKVIEDKRLSFKARGLLIYMLSKPDDWKFFTGELVKRSSKDGLSSIRTALKEIESAGYLVRKRERSNKGTFTSQDWILTDIPASVPQVEKPHVDNPQVEKPHVDNQPLPNTDFKPNTDLPNTDQLLTGDSHSTQDVFTLWENNWGFPNGIAQQDLTKWINSFGADLVHHAITFALRRNITSKGADRYLAKKLDGYKQSNITTVEQAKEYEKRHEQQMSREYQQKGNYYPRRSPNHEVIPEWMKKDMERKKESNANQGIQRGYVVPDDSMDPMPK
ncbi:DnaD domain protein [Limosilactobacillus vaginalis]|uniref:DnaD domain protein n=1 Tax=Limosilactobacillus vaginalis TaxID=1633 RepID=UPI0024BB9F3A|nr:DnaD domain protein [Limosilactobacillus vaginalis]